MPGFSHAEERLNTLTHGLGFVLSVPGGGALVWLAARAGDAWHIASCSVYVATLILLYLASTLYHRVQAPRSKHILRVVDHSCIYLLIAGTYTPFTLMTLGGGWGWTLFGLVWGLAVIGIMCKLFWTGRFEAASTGLYVAMGWFVVVAADPILERFPAGLIGWLLAGGAAYTVGVVFYAVDRKPYMHTVWHLCVLAGSACHFIAVARYVVPPAAWA
jgi:hemolysin III